MATTDQNRQQWGSSYRLLASEKWKAKSAAMGRAVTQALVDYANPHPGMEVLDLASGTGEPAISLAERVGPQGQVTALDLSADLLAIAAVRGKDRGLQNISFHEADAQKLPFPDQSFDLATSRFGVMFFDDIDKALRELHRVLRPGAKACFAVWDTFEQPYFQSTIGIVVRHVGGPAISPGGQNPFRFAVPGRLSSVLGNAGFSAIEEKVVTLPWPWPGPPEELWEQTKAVSAPFRSLLDRVPTQKWPEINAEVIAAIRTYADNDCIRFEVTVRMVSGTKHSR